MTAVISPKLLIAAALAAEARPLIRRFQLKRAGTCGRADLFSNDAVNLIVTGSGKIRSAVATAAFLSTVEDIDAFTAFNIGIAGAADESRFEIGATLLIHRIVDDASGRELFPDLLVDTGLREAALITVDRPRLALSNAADAACAVDMEGAGFFEAAAAFLPPHRIACLKIISDYFSPSSLTSRDVTRLLEASLLPMEQAWEAYRTAAAHSMHPGEASDGLWLKNTAETLRLTVTQQHQLARWAGVYRIRSGGVLPPVSPEKCTSKRERTQRFEALKQILLA